MHHIPRGVTCSLPSRAPKPPLGLSPNTLILPRSHIPAMLAIFSMIPSFLLLPSLSLCRPPSPHTPLHPPTPPPSMLTDLPFYSLLWSLILHHATFCRNVFSPSALLWVPHCSSFCPSQLRQRKQGKCQDSEFWRCPTQRSCGLSALAAVDSRIGFPLETADCRMIPV